MHPAFPAESTATQVPPAALTRQNARETEALGETIAALAAHLHAATYELLVLLRDFEARNGWNTGFLSCAHWLHWRTGIDLGAAREKVRVAKALGALPCVSMAMQHGQLSYAKVRALTRVATPENEPALLDLALAGTAAHVERFVRAWRRVDRAEAAKLAEAQHLNRQLSTWVDDDGMVVIRGRLTPEVGAVVQRALEAAADRLFRDSAQAPSGNVMAEELTLVQRRADALGLIAEAALAADLDAGTAGDRYQVVLHVNAESVEPPPAASPTPDAADDAFDGAIELDHGALYVSAETSRRITCDASTVHLHHDAEGEVVESSRKTRTIPPAIRRALAARDTGCRFPGCTSRRCDAHHIVHWADEGDTTLANLVLLCRRHHRAVHEGGFGVTRDANGEVTFTRPDGQRLNAAPPAPPNWHHDYAPAPVAPRRLRCGTAPGSTSPGPSTCCVPVAVAGRTRKKKGRLWELWKPFCGFQGARGRVARPPPGPRARRPQLRQLPQHEQLRVVSLRAARRR